MHGLLISGTGDAVVFWHATQKVSLHESKPLPSQSSVFDCNSYPVGSCELNAMPGHHMLRIVPWRSFDIDSDLSQQGLCGGEVVSILHKELGALLQPDSADALTDTAAAAIRGAFDSKPATYKLAGWLESKNESMTSTAPAVVSDVLLQSPL